MGGAAALTTIGEALAARAADDRVALRTDGGSWTWRAVVAESAARAAEFGRAHVGVLLDNVPEYVFLLGGAALAGGVVVGINPTRRGDGLAHDIRHTDCSVVVTDAAHEPLLRGLDLGGAAVRLVDDPGWRFPAAAVPGPLPGEDALYLLIFTSGSTGAPKAVRMSQGRAHRNAAAAATAFTPDDVLYCAMPLFHGNALLTNLFPAVISGASVVLKPRFSATSFLDDVRRHGCTYFNYVGRALSYVLATPEAPDDADNPLRWGMGSEASPRDIREFRRRFGCVIVEGYGSSEGGIALQRSPGTPRGALGRPREGEDVAVVDPATGKECAPGAVGELVRRDGVGGFEGYYRNEAADEERSRGGWFWSGDLGYRDEEGYLWFAGRSADWLRVDGENFGAAPVERILGRFPGVAAVAVYAVPDPSAHDRVMAALELDEGAPFDPAAFASFLDEQPDLGTKWAPAFVRVLPRLPTTATGKLDKQPLRRQGWEAPDEVWWRSSPSEPYRQMTSADVDDLRGAFAAAGRSHLLDR